MTLKEIQITGFKNIADARLEFSPNVNALLGNNGMGKSNLLDAIYFLSFCKSFSGMTDSQVIRRGDDFAMVRAVYLRHGIDEQLSLGITPGRRKSLKRQGKEYQRLSAHIGAFPLVLSSPQDVDIIRGASDERRRLMDMVISQTDPLYLDALIRYGRALDQRNRMLRDAVTDRSLFAAVELQMDMAATAIHAARSSWVERLTAIFSRYYEAIAGDGAEHVALSYDSALNAPGATLTSLLDASRRRDEALRHTSTGPHRDDLEMLIDGMPMRRAASQGQCKTYAIALRLAQYEFLRDNMSLRPLLLLDDIFDKLDAARVERIMELVAGDGFGQIFITDTNRTHLDEIMRRTGSDYSLWHVDSGAFAPL
ncbi:DNA replication/repair protein RecF [uncultured Muribaculum sp.]|uniref:DNA replication/repair protein RecF n=1 Tax=uncultured Muribaculum sp. TaxID=1918613 RepID=UPI0025E8C043|nr:DNA replication and repair protein RecF [uncultured Muribaculum sp.]